MPGAGFSNVLGRKAPPDRSALKPYWGKLTVRNFRGGYGNNGIMRSPFSAMAPLDHVATRYCGAGRRHNGNLNSGVLHVDPTWGARIRRRTARPSSNGCSSASDGGISNSKRSLNWHNKRANGARRWAWGCCKSGSAKGTKHGTVLGTL